MPGFSGGFRLLVGVFGSVLIERGSLETTGAPMLGLNAGQCQQDLGQLVSN